MKKPLLLTLVIISSLVVTRAQISSPAGDIFHKYADKDGVTSMTLNKQMLDAIDVDFDWNDQLKHISGDIYSLKLLLFDHGNIAIQNIREINNALEESSLREMDIPKNEEAGDLKFLKVYGDKESQYYKNIYMLLLTKDNMGIFLAVNGKLKIKNES